MFDEWHKTQHCKSSNRTATTGDSVLPVKMWKKANSTTTGSKALGGRREGLESCSGTSRDLPKGQKNERVLGT